MAQRFQSVSTRTTVSTGVTYIKHLIRKAPPLRRWVICVYVFRRFETTGSGSVELELCLSSCSCVAVGEREIAACSSGSVELEVCLSQKDTDLHFHRR